MKNKKIEVSEKRDPTAKRLDAIIRLLLDGQLASEKNKRITRIDQVLGLHSIGLTDTEIGNIIGYERKNVAAMRTNAKKMKKRGKANE
ncbi:hypothetical protein [Nitrososphaera sp.]|uniref:hypothetical protein n=1 Tax=Nitrososphaera sp. TaxID=1971748 RepID=UPI00181210ED|nr:hypothetical protein [Nitrososphaera sp.]NWG37056.1 hypothetical protein [Nitrososphaera sp.]